MCVLQFEKIFKNVHNATKFVKINFDLVSVLICESYFLCRFNFITNMGPFSRKSHSAESRTNTIKASIDDLTKRFYLCQIRRPLPARRNSRRARIRYL